MTYLQIYFLNLTEILFEETGTDYADVMKMNVRGFVQTYVKKIDRTRNEGYSQRVDEGL